MSCWCEYRYHHCVPLEKNPLPATLSSLIRLLKPVYRSHAVELLRDSAVAVSIFTCLPLTPTRTVDVTLALLSSAAHDSARLSGHHSLHRRLSGREERLEELVARQSSLLRVSHTSTGSSFAGRSKWSAVACFVPHPERCLPILPVIQGNCSSLEQKNSQRRITPLSR